MSLSPGNAAQSNVTHDRTVARRQSHVQGEGYLVADRTVSRIMAEMPEIGLLSNKRVSKLATKFAYSAMRDIAFSSIREFYPDIAAHYIRKHREKVAALSTRDAAN